MPRRVALVTGGGHGIGRAIARGLAEDGIAVAVGDLRLEWAKECAGLIETAGGVAVAVHLDVTHVDSAAAAVRATVDRFGGLDVLVNNAGGNGRPPAAFDEIAEEDWAAILELNLTAHWRMVRLAAPWLRHSGSGRVVSVSSASVHRGLPTGLAAYLAAKGGVIALVRALARELGPSGVTVNAVAPGFIATDTPKVSIFGPEGRRREQEKWMAEQAVQRPASVQDVAAAVRYLASPAASFVTGHTLTVDGGWGMPG